MAHLKSTAIMHTNADRRLTDGNEEEGDGQDSIDSNKLTASSSFKESNTV